MMLFWFLTLNGKIANISLRSSNVTWNNNQCSNKITLFLFTKRKQNAINQDSAITVFISHIHEFMKSLFEWLVRSSSQCFFFIFIFMNEYVIPTTDIHYDYYIISLSAFDKGKIMLYTKHKRSTMSGVFIPISQWIYSSSVNKAPPSLEHFSSRELTQ